jgi:hypothetical protein
VLEKMARPFLRIPFHLVRMKAFFVVHRRLKHFIS